MLEQLGVEVVLEKLGVEVVLEQHQAVDVVWLHRSKSGLMLSWFSKAEPAGGLQLWLCPWLV